MRITSQGGETEMLKITFPAVDGYPCVHVSRLQPYTGLCSNGEPSPHTPIIPTLKKSPPKWTYLPTYMFTRLPRHTCMDHLSHFSRVQQRTVVVFSLMSLPDPLERIVIAAGNKANDSLQAAIAWVLMLNLLPASPCHATHRIAASWPCTSHLQHGHKPLD